MSRARHARDAGEVTIPEMMTLLVTGMAAVGAIFTLGTWHRVVHWLVSKEVLVAGADHPILGLPAAEGAGLDARRVVVAVAVLALAIVGLLAAARAKSSAGAGQ